VEQFITDPAEAYFCLDQTNKALASRDEIDRAIQILDNHSLPHHGDYPKNWDNLLAMYWCTTRFPDPDAVILDVAATVPHSAFLPGLKSLGYYNLTSINLGEETRMVDDILYMDGDVTDMKFVNETFDLISCLSVIEHGVDIVSFYKECSRVLKPGGMLIVSTDYWQDDVDTKGQTAWGSPIKVFNKHEVDAMIVCASIYGLHPVKTQIDTDCKDRVVNWMNMDYTFMNLCFVKKIDS
jgi:SAM-dependent methyltransferase